MNIEFNTNTDRYELIARTGSIVQTYGRYRDALRGMRRRNTDV